MNRFVVLVLAYLLLAPTTLAAAPANRKIAEVDALIASARAEGVFLNKTTSDGQPSVSHAPTGMDCNFYNFGLGRLEYDPASGRASCLMKRPRYALSLSAMRVAPDATLESVMSRLAAAIPAKGELKVTESEVGKAIAEKGLNDPNELIRSFRAGKDRWRIYLARRGDWVVAMQTLAQEDNNMSEAQQGIEWRLNMIHFGPPR